VIKFVDKSTYFGEFKFGTLHGHGVFKEINGSISKGKWSLGQQHGLAVRRWAGGTLYSG
jgi:hypothetical protein